MLVSLIVPSYNHHEYLATCLLSLSEQTWRDLELILIDDLSSDETFAVAKSFVASKAIQSRFRKITLERNQENLGAANTINKAIRMSGGDVIMIVNSDDSYAPARVAQCVAEIEAGAQFVFSDVCFVDDSGRPSDDNEALIFRTAIQEIDQFPVVSAAFFTANRSISTGNFCFTRALYDRIGGFSDLKYCHDWDFALAAIRYTEPVFIRQELYQYRLHDTNSFKSLSAVAEGDSRFCYERFFSAVLRGDVTNKQLLNLLRSPKLWEGLVAAAGPVAEDEWKRACAGKPLRQIANQAPRMRPKKDPRKDVTPPGDGAGETAKAALRFLEAPLLYLGHGGDIGDDGWIGAQADLSIWAPRDTTELTVVCRLPADVSDRCVIATLLRDEHIVSQQSRQLKSRGQAEIMFTKLPSAAGKYELSLNVVVAGITEEVEPSRCCVLANVSSRQAALGSVLN